MQYRTLLATALLLSAGSAAPLLTRQENSTSVSASSDNGNAAAFDLPSTQSQPPSVPSSGGSSTNEKVAPSGVNEFIAGPSSIMSASGSVSSQIGNSRVSGGSSGSMGSDSAVGGQEVYGELPSGENVESQQGNSFAGDPSSTAESAPFPSASGSTSQTMSTYTPGLTGAQEEHGNSQTESQEPASGSAELAAVPPSGSETDGEDSSHSGDNEDSHATATGHVSETASFTTAAAKAT